MASEMKQCPNCGTPNDVFRAVCETCQTPLTIYGSQLTGEQNTASTAVPALADKPRPGAVAGMVALELLFLLFGPLVTVFRAFAARPTVGSELTNYTASAFGTVGAIFTAVFFLPIAFALAIFALGVWNQRAWAWMGSAGALGLVALFALIHFAHAPLSSLFWLVFSGVLGYFWFRREIKAWFGLI